MSKIQIMTDFASDISSADEQKYSIVILQVRSMHGSSIPTSEPPKRSFIVLIFPTELFSPEVFRQSAEQAP